VIRHYYLPFPYPDELVGSVLVRASRHRGIAVTRMASILAGCKQSSWPFLINSRLDAFAENQDVCATELLFNHTVFPYVTAFMSQGETERLVKVVLGGADNRSVVLCQSATVGGFSLRYCPVCLKEDLNDYAEAYWHRSHILPFVQVCDKHGHPLLQNKNTRRNLSCHITTLPGEESAESKRCYCSSLVADAICKLSTQLLLTRERIEPTDWIHLYRVLAKSRGFPQQGNGFSNQSFLNGFRSFYSTELLGVSLTWRTTHNAWPVLMLREGGAPPFVTAKHVLLQVFLENAELPEKVAAIKPGKKPTDLYEFDRKLSLKLQLSLGRLEEGTRLTVTELLKKIGCWQFFRHNRQHLPISASLVEEFRKTEFSERQIGRRRRNACGR